MINKAVFSVIIAYVLLNKATLVFKGSSVSPFASPFSSPFHVLVMSPTKSFSTLPYLASNNCLKHILFNAVQTFGEFSIPDVQMKSKMKDAIRLLLILMYYHCVSRNILTFIVKVQSVNHTLDAFIVDNMVEEAL